MAPGVMVRPQMVTYALALGFYAVMRESWTQEPSAVVHTAAAHGAMGQYAWRVFDGLTRNLVAAFLAEAWEKRETTYAKHLAIAAVLMAAAVFATPLGADIIPARTPHAGEHDGRVH